MKTTFIFFLSFCLLASCQKENQTDCNVAHPETDLPWLSDLIKRNTPDENLKTANITTQTEITSYTYKGETVFLVDMCVGCADNLVAVYNCQGEMICQFGGIAGINTCPDFDKEAVKQQVIWSN